MPDLTFLLVVWRVLDPFRYLTGFTKIYYYSPANCVMLLNLDLHSFAFSYTNNAAMIEVYRPPSMTIAST